MAVRQAHTILANIFGPKADHGDDQRSRHEYFDPADHILLPQIRSTHNNTVKNYDYSSLFTIVKNILEHSTKILDEIVQGGVSQPQIKVIQKKAPTPIDTNFNAVPLCDLRQIVCEIMSCGNQSGPEVAHKTTMSILRKLSTYSWEAKAVVTLAAFAMEFGDFSWLFYQNQSHQSAKSLDDQEFLKSLGTLKRVFVFANSSELLKRQPQALVELKRLKDLIITSLQVIETFFEVEKLSASYDPKGQSPLPITIVVYWIIKTVVACATTVTSLTCEGVDKTQDLTFYSTNIDSILDKVTERLKELKEKEDLAIRYWNLKKLLEHPTEIVEVFKAMFLTKDINVVPLFDCHTNTRIEIEELTNQNVFLLISGLDISDDDIGRIEKIQKKIEEENRVYKIVWIPIVEDWTKDEKEFEVVRSKMKWYTVKSVSKTAGAKFIKEDWKFSSKTTNFVVMNQPGIVENSNAYHLICLGGLDFFPFDKLAEKKFHEEVDWLETIVEKMGVTELKELIKEQGSYIFLYGGRDQKWTKKFKETVEKLKTNYSYIVNEKLKTKISCFCVGKTEKESKGNVNSEFWNSVENLFLSNENNNKNSNVSGEEVHSVTKDIQKLLSYKYEEGWVLVSKGFRPVMTGHGFTILNALDELNYKLEKGTVAIDEKITFTEIFQECYTKVIKEFGARCCRLHIKGFRGKQLEERNCAECSTTMEMTILYECCHKGSEMAAHHDHDIVVPKEDETRKLKYKRTMCCLTTLAIGAMVIAFVTGTYAAIVGSSSIS